jgi:hypothetical protein
VDWPAKWGFEGLGIEATRASRRLFLNRSIAEVKRALLLWAGKKLLPKSKATLDPHRLCGIGLAVSLA